MMKCINCSGHSFARSLPPSPVYPIPCPLVYPVHSVSFHIDVFFGGACSGVCLVCLVV